MLNRSGVTKASYTNVRQILGNVEYQYSVGCIVPTSVGTSVGTKTIAKAGTPIKIDFMNLQTPAVKADGSSQPFNAVLLHDVDVTGKSENGTALIFGFVDVNKVESDVAELIETAKVAVGATQMIKFIKY